MSLLADNVNVSWISVAIFFLFIVITLYITYWASKRSKSRADFYNAGGSISGFQNGLAIAGDYASAASFLGVSGILFTKGMDGSLYLVGFMVSWPIIMALMAENLRNLGKYNFSDIVSYRVEQAPVRLTSAISSLIIVMFYLIAQMIGAGQIIENLFGLKYLYALILVGSIMILYVTFGGMFATTWVQIIKAVMLLAGGTLLVLLILIYHHFDLSFMFSSVINHYPKGEWVLESTHLTKGGLETLSLGIGLMFGTAGLPHILMRFFTVKDSEQARQSVFYGATFIGYFYILVIIIGFGAISVLGSNSEYLDPKALEAGSFNVLGGSNLVSVHLSRVLGGEYLFGFISAVAFATILAVVAGLTLSGAMAIAHDICNIAVNKGQLNDQQEIKIMRLSVIGIGIVAIFFGYVFRNLNTAFMVGIAFSVAASTNFPALILSLYWPKLTTRGLVWGNSISIISTLTMIILSQSVWGDIFGFTPLFPFVNVALFSMPIAFFAIYIFSITDTSDRATGERKKFNRQFAYSILGVAIQGTKKY